MQRMGRAVCNQWLCNVKFATAKASGSPAGKGFPSLTAMQRRDQLIGSKRPRSGQKGADGAAPALDGSSSASGSGSDEDAADEKKHKRRKHKDGKHKHSKSKSARKAKESKSKNKKRRPDKAEAAKNASVRCLASLLLFIFGRYEMQGLLAITAQVWHIKAIACMGDALHD